MSGLYYIQNGWSNGCALWWRATRCGYTIDLDKAHKFTKSEAEAIIDDPSRHDIAYDVDEVDKRSIPLRHILFNDLRKVKGITCKS